MDSLLQAPAQTIEVWQPSSDLDGVQVRYYQAGPLPKVNGNFLQISNLHPQKRDQTDWSAHREGGKQKAGSQQFTEL